MVIKLIESNRYLNIVFTSIVPNEQFENAFDDLSQTQLPIFALLDAGDAGR